MRMSLFIIMLCTIYCSETIADIFPVDFALTKSNANTLYIDALLDNAVATQFMLDTGSSVVVLNRETFSQLQQHGSEIIETSTMGARLANGRIKLVKRYRISSLSLGPACQFSNVEVAVMNKGNNILGMSLLTAASPFTIFADPAKLRLSQCGKKSSEMEVSVTADVQTAH